MDLRAGTKLRSAACSTEIIVVKPPLEGRRLYCGGLPMVGPNEAVSGNGEIASDANGGTLLGKRYTDAEGTVEVICTKPGTGALALDDCLLTVKAAKPLPSSD